MKIKDKETRKLIRKMKADGWSNRAIGRELGIPESSIRYFLKQQGELQYDPEDVAFKPTYSSYGLQEISVPQNGITLFPKKYVEAEAGTDEHELFQCYKKIIHNLHKPSERAILLFGLDGIQRKEMVEDIKEGKYKFTCSETGKPLVLDKVYEDRITLKVEDVALSKKQQMYLEQPTDLKIYGGCSNISRIPKKILVIADTQCKPSEDLSYMSWIGKYINDKKPDVVVHIGDHFDFESLSSYDKGKKSFEGRRLKADIEAGNKGLELLTREFLSDNYHPRMVFCMGNHEARFDRLSEDMPELDGFVGTETLNLEALGWEVHPFLKPVEIEGIYFVHYLANPFSGKPYGGTALNQLKTVGRSFVVGHKQCLDVAIRPTIDGKHQIGIINGAAYPFEERYKGYQGNNHFRGVTMLHEVEDGFALPMFISLEYLKGKYN